MVYFIQDADGPRGPVKIGYSHDPEDRARRLGRQLGRPLRAHAIIPGGAGVERLLHERFAEGRLRGEWFDLDTPGLYDFITHALLFEGMWPEDGESPGILEVLRVLEAAECPAPDCSYSDGWA